MTDRNLIVTDHPLDVEQQDKLRALLDVLIPSSEDRKLPSAGETNFIRYLGEEAADFLPALLGVLDAFEASFAQLPAAERHSLLRAFSEANKDLFDGLLFHAYSCYYQDDRVLSAIGAGVGPPFPRGNEVEAGDLSLLDPVVRSDKRYRRTR